MNNYTKSPPAQSAELAGQTADITPELFNQWAEYIDGSPQTKATYTANIKRFADWLQAKDIKKPARSDVIAYRDELQAAHKPATVHGYLIAVKLFFQWTDLMQLYPDIAKRVKTPAVDMLHKKDPLTSTQAIKVLSSLDSDSVAGLRDYAIIALMLTTGLRTRSIILANVRDIDNFEGKAVLYYQGKGHNEKAEFVKLEPPVYNAICRYLQARGAEPAPQDPLFASAAPRNKGERMTTRSISRIVKNALKAAGLQSDRLTAHSLRHTAATLAMLNGATLQEVQQLLGHKSIEITMIYLHTLERISNTSTERIANALF